MTPSTAARPSTLAATRSVKPCERPNQSWIANASTRQPPRPTVSHAARHAGLGTNSPIETPIDGGDDPDGDRCRRTCDGERVPGWPRAHCRATRGRAHRRLRRSEPSEDIRIGSIASHALNWATRRFLLRREDGAFGTASRSELRPRRRPVLPSLELLSHRVRQIPAEPAQLVNAPSADIIFVDARRRPRRREVAVQDPQHDRARRPAPARRHRGRPDGRLDRLGRRRRDPGDGRSRRGRCARPPRDRPA